MPTDRKQVVTENMTVDGVIDATEGWFSAAGEEDGVDSSDLEATLREHMEPQLVDEFRLFVYPTMIGRGQRLFEDETPRPRLQLADTRPFRSGVVLLTYPAV